MCCVFLVSESGSTINQNCTYIRNPGFPGSYAETNEVQYTLNKCAKSKESNCNCCMSYKQWKNNLDICHLRLDFETFHIQGTGNALEVDQEGDPMAPVDAGGVCKDTFNVNVNTNQRILTICGQNTGQHSKFIKILVTLPYVQKIKVKF